MGKQKGMIMLSEEELRRICEEAADRAVEKHTKAAAEQAKKDERRRSNEKVRITKKKLEKYRRVKASLAETVEFTPEEKIELRWHFVEDLMGSAGEVMAKSTDTMVTMETRRKHDLFDIQSIDRALGLYRAEADANPSDEFRRRFKELCEYYIDEPGMAVTEIAEANGVSEKTVYKDIGIACGILAVYLLGM